MKYELIYWDYNLKKHVKPYTGTYDGARKQACRLIRFSKAKYSVNIEGVRIKGNIRVTSPLGEVWSSDRKLMDYAYLSHRGTEKGIIWNVNPDTGKLTSKAGYVD